MIWANRSERHRPVAAILAVCITVGLFSLLWYGQQSKSRAEKPTRRVVLVIVPETIVVSPAPMKAPVPLAPDAPRRIPSRRPATSAEEKGTQRSVSAQLGKAGIGTETRIQTEAPSTPQAHEAAAPASAASAPLNFDGATIRAAGASSRGSVSRLAEASGQELPAIRASPLEHLGSGVARAGKSDCLAPNENGSLLSIPIIAYGALTGRCK